MSQAPRVVIGSSATSPQRRSRPSAPVPGIPVLSETAASSQLTPISPRTSAATSGAPRPRRTPIQPIMPETSTASGTPGTTSGVSSSRQLSPLRPMTPPRQVISSRPEGPPQLVTLPRTASRIPLPPRQLSPPRQVEPRTASRIPPPPPPKTSRRPTISSKPGLGMSSKPGTSIPQPNTESRIPPPPPKTGSRIPPPPPPKSGTGRLKPPSPATKSSRIPAAILKNPNFVSIAAKLKTATYDFFDITWNLAGQFRRNFQQMAEALNSGFYDYSRRLVFDYIMRDQHSPGQILFSKYLYLSSPVDRVNLLWYLHVADHSEAMNLTPDEKEFLTSLAERPTPDALIHLLGPRYQGPRDRASLVFAALSGRSTHRPASEDLPRYRDVIRYTPEQIWTLTKIYPIALHEDQWISPYPPYVHVALQDEVPYERLYAEVNEDNVQHLMDTYGISLGWRVSNMVDYFRQEIRKYGPVLTRPKNQLPPPMLTGLTAAQIKATLRVYTLKEIVEAYEVTQTWGSRSQLWRLVEQDSRAGSRWTWRHRYCNNDETMNIEEFEPHGQINKADLVNPTLSYGVQRNYRCYQLEELILSFSPDAEGVIQFKVPDYEAGRIDPTTRTQLLQYFPINSIQQLHNFLTGVRPPVGIQPFHASRLSRLNTAIQRGIEYNTGTGVYFRQMLRRYQEFSPDQQNVAREFMAWFFLFGMWIRFWHGPNHPWTYSKAIARTQAGRTNETGMNSICPRERNEHTFIQLAVKNRIMDQTDAPLRQWIQELRFPNYNSYNGEVTLGSDGSLMRYVREVETGRQCQGFAGSEVPLAGHALITQLFRFSNTEFDRFLADNLRPILDLEREIVSRIRNHLNGTDSTGPSTSMRLEAAEARTLGVVTARVTELANPVQHLDPFDPTRMEQSIHTSDVSQ